MTWVGPPNAVPAYVLKYAHDGERMARGVDAPQWCWAQLWVRWLGGRLGWEGILRPFPTLADRFCYLRWAQRLPRGRAEKACY